VIQIEAARVGQLREKQLDGAATFGAAAMNVFNALDRTMRGLAVPPLAGETDAVEWLTEFKGGVDASREELRQATLLLGRLEMLFGENSATAGSAGSLVERLHLIFEELDKHPGEVSVVTNEFEAATEDFSRFHREAHAVFSRSLLRLGR
jgi:hypothetical protein